MVSRKQGKLLRYVEDGDVPKLKSYLRKHAGLSVAFAGRRGRSPLHVACAQRDDIAMRLLLKHGADPLSQDRKGNTPLHLAAREAVKKGARVFEDLVVPLRKCCPGAMDVPNGDGVSPRDVLQSMKKQQQQCPGTAAEEGDGPGKEQADREWYHKLFGECEDEFYQKCGRYEEDFLMPDAEPQTYDDWADRLTKEYAAKRARAAGSGVRGKAARAAEERQKEKERREFQERLEAEHRHYLEHAGRKEEELAGRRKRRYERGCADVFSRASGSGGRLTYEDIPWPAPKGTVEEMVAVILHGVEQSDRGPYRRYLRQQQAVWHPDRFIQRCGERLAEADRQKILGMVTALSQALNKLSESVR
ncbi:NF-kappa-B inhibitor-like protein 1 isoform X2 [Scyliorhinus torazame]